MTKVIYAERISKQGKIRLGCTAAIFDEQGRVFLTRRADNGQWCLPGGGMESGESVKEVEAPDMFGRHRQRILDTLERHPQALIK